jgi:DNA-binding SARP family transcriptional activator
VPGGLVIEVQCLGGFALRVDGSELRLGEMRPKSRSVLRWLAMEAGNPVHRESLFGALWPEDDLSVATRKLHVAITSLRQAVGTIEARRGRPLVVRDGQSYRFALAPDVKLDILEFSRLLLEADTARIRGDFGRAADAVEAALDQYHGDLLPEEGPAEWALEMREHLRLRAADAAARLVDLLNAADAEPSRVIASCERGLRIDRYNDSLWKRLIAVHEARGDLAKAARLRSQYSEMLLELGI